MDHHEEDTVREEFTVAEYVQVISNLLKIVVFSATLVYVAMIHNAIDVTNTIEAMDAEIAVCHQRWSACEIERACD